MINFFDIKGPNPIKDSIRLRIKFSKEEYPIIFPSESQIKTIIDYSNFGRLSCPRNVNVNDVSYLQLKKISQNIQFFEKKNMGDSFLWKT